MARLILSDIIEDIRGTVGTHTYSYWKGIHLVKIRSVNFRTPWESNNQSPYRALIGRLSQYWMSGLTQAQRDGWESYAEYIATLGPPFYGPGVVKLTGLRQYGGIMSGVNAFVLTNQLRFSIGKTDILEDDPEAIDPPPQPVFQTLTFEPGPPKKLIANFDKPATLFEDTWVRCFCHGHRMAHLIIAQVAQTEEDPGFVWDVDYDCTVEPPAAAPPWTLLGTDFCTAAAGIITIDTITPGGVSQCAYRLGMAGFNNSVGWIVEFKMKTIVSAANDIRLTFEIYDGTYYERLDISDALINLSYSGGSYVMDTTDVLHVYQIRGKGTRVQVFVDDVLRIEGTLYVATANKRVYFGDKNAAPGGNSKSEWDYIKVYDGGNTPPTNQFPEWQNMRYAQGSELSLQNELYSAQIDFISASGRYSAPSAIKSASVHDSFPGGLWASVLWDTLVWG